MDKIKIKIDGRVAEIESAPEVVADNAEYEVEFDVNERDGWNQAVPMTALFVRRDARYTAVVMDVGETICTMPPQTGTNVVYVGLTQDDMRTTTPAAIKVQRSIRTVANDPLPEPTEDVYAQILAAYAGIKILSGKGAPTSATQGKVNQLYRDEDTQRLYICTATDGGYTWAAVVSETEDAVTYTAQTLTEEQKTQARANIGAGTSNFSGLYNDLPDKPNIPAATVIDTTLSKSGQAADAKAVGDAIGKKIDAPQTAQVGEVLTVEEIGDDGKPKKWKTAPGVNITTELTQESTDAQVPSAKAAYDAIQNATDKDAVRFVAQKLTDTQKQQARENIGAKPVDFPVTITPSTTDGVTTYTADKTFAEIKAAYDSGANVCVNLYGNPLFLSEISKDYVGFGGIIKDYCNVVIINSENIITAYDYYLFALNYFNDIIIDDNGNLFVTKDYSFVTMTVPVPNLDVKDGSVLKIMASGLEWVEDTSLPSPTTAQVGQVVKVKAVDADGKITETEAVDMPMQKTLKWITVHSSDLTETKRELIISTDTDGKSIADYNPVGLTLIISTPADETQTDNNGAPWVYPSATKKDNAIRVIGSIAGWKTTARDSVFAFYGGSSAMTCTGNVNNQLATYKIDGYALDGVTAMLNGNTNHFPVGTHVEVSILCEVPDANVMTT